MVTRVGVLSSCGWKPRQFLLSCDGHLPSVMEPFLLMAAFLTSRKTDAWPLLVLRGLTLPT